LKSKLVVNNTIMKLIEKGVRVLDIPVSDIVIQKDRISKGKFGKVYMAKWGTNNVVIKVITVDTEEEKQDVKCEAHLTHCLKHPNVVKLFGVTWVKDKKLGLVLELAEHGSLDLWIGKTDHEKARKIALGIVDGLKYVHSQHVIHRDIKPQNILMFGPENDMIPKIADFGVSKVIHTVRMTHTSVGQQFYMAPEVRMYEPYSFPVDIFSLAMTLFEMFSEQPILPKSEVFQLVMSASMRNEFGEIPEKCKVPGYLRDIIILGWDKKPEKRPSLFEYQATLKG